MVRFRHAPVEYVLAVLRFPLVSDFGRFASEMQALLEAEYPLSKSFEAMNYRLEIGQNGMQVTEEKAPMWQFSSLDQQWAVILGANFVGLHTVQYTDHKDFLGKFVHTVGLAMKPERVGVKVVEGLGLRYLDLVVPAEGEAAEDYLVQAGLLPSKICGVDGLQVVEGIHACSYKTSRGNLRFQLLRNPPSVFPAELVTPLTMANGWADKKVESDFFVIDTDHGSDFRPPVRIGEIDVLESMVGLRQAISDIFLATASDHAKAVWNGEK
ncbi:TIGR04255 family protein [Mesorhizobium sp. B2-4-14]|uniref:TIGR04255 family protein n=1 Tax=Mesorhizobium sp. B2-4-14 TaxID=2589935 RepID=UPI00112DA046|nr:TIGR04255 family protein [Mesorhizobium sp. B2-4-14]TPL05827.1 TIGR04255 family protein [Mesorhizobium sp. B2-4-14]